MIFEIVILAMIAAFLGMRLYSVLGQRAEHEEEVIPNRFDSGEQAQQQAEARPQPTAQVIDLPRNPNLHPSVEQGVRAIAAADRSFDLLSFIEGAKGAYAMVLEAFWKGDKETLRELCDLDVYRSFAGAIDARVEAGHTLDNKLIRIEDATVRDAELDGRTARVTVLFVSDIAAVTRDAEGNLIAGSLDDAIESRDIWTFSRQVDAAGPDWILDETDEG
ncbi:Tim44/TimA family putative adaptor protein [Parerythrobacter aestuarii]|uniref:Tim44/TimA family putative adaptor protein n=1 Tax=Parerythrobacter aestuarii TaxID=3020909 RepID=UPI0024DEDA6F|nr:Tim44/TimA family putative adaptor protein [Parerythrobacter aestuarii]